MKSNNIETNKSEEIYQLILDNIDELIGILNPYKKFNFEFINENVFEKILKYTKKDLIGRSFFDIIHPNDVNKIETLLYQKKALTKESLEIILIDNSKKEKWFRIKIRHFKNKKKQKRTFVNLKSIEKQKDLEKILDESKDSLKVITNKIPEIRFWKLFSPENFEDALYSSYEMLQIFIENIPQYIFWKDKNLNYLGCNYHYAKLIGIDIPENIIGKKDKDLISNHDKLKILEINEKKVLESGNAQSNELIKWRIGTKDSLLKINRIPLYDSNNIPVGLLVTYDDITELISKEEKIRRERDILEGFMETSPVGIIIINRNGIITFINNQAEKVFNIKKSKVLLTNLNDHIWRMLDINGNKIPEEKELFNIVKKTKSSAFDLKFLIKDYKNKDILISVNSSPLFNDSGEFNGLIATIEDITEKQKAKQELIESEQKFRTISEQSLMGIAIIQEGQIKYLNKQLVNITGYKSEELKKLKKFEYLEIIHPEDKEFVLKKLDSILNKELGEYHFQFRMYNNLNIIRWVDNFSTRIIYQGKPAILSTIIDFTEKKIAEIKLKESGEKYKNLFENSPNMIALLDIEGNFLTANAKLLNFFNFKKEYLVNKNLQTLQNYIPDHFDDLISKFKLVLREKSFNPFDIRIQLENNKTHWLSIQANLTDIEGKKIVQIIMRNIDNYKNSINIIHLNELRLETLSILNQMTKASDKNLVEYALNKAVELTKSIFGILIFPKKKENEIYFSKILNDADPNHLNSNGYDTKILKNMLKAKDIIIKNQVDDDFSVFGDNNHLPYLKIERFMIIPIKEEGKTVAITCVINKSREYTNLDISQLTLLIDGVWKTIQKKKSEEALRLSEKRYRSLLNSSSMGIIEINLLTDDITFINPSLLKMLGYEKEHISKKFIFKKIYSEDIGNLFKDSEEKELEFRVYDNKGKLKWLAGKRTNQFNQNGDLVSFRLWLDDVTEKKMYEKLITELNINFLNFTTDIQANIQLLLGTCVNLLGGILAIHVNKNEKEKKFRIKTNDNRTFYYYDFEKYDKDLFVFEFFKGEHDFPQTILDIDKSLYADTDPIMLNYNIKSGYGKLIKSEDKFNNAVCVFFDHNPNITHDFQLILFLIADAIAIEQSRWKVKQNLKNQNKMLNEMNKLKVELFSRTSHELKTPLISIKGFTELLLKIHKSKMDSDMISIIEEIMDGAKRLEKIINMLLESSKLDQNLLILNKKEDDLIFLLRFCVNELQSLANLRNQKINLELDDKLVVKFDKERIYEVVSNLLVNAIKYTPPNGTINVKSERIKNDYVISISDTGVGLTDIEKKQLFKQFGKIERYGHGWDLGIEGTGLGLYISKKIIDLHNGKIWAESEGRNKGSIFSFSLPYSND
ncbi:MAG: PAS domain S-box protein [Candidatus Lokiarchaeota archaeon]|nr:PAS domain S-box protein [Candidatus Lokiarchaeota archaeon]